MDRLAFNAAAAINEQRLTRQATAHELANLSTPGFKRSYEAAMKAVEAEGAGMPTRVQPQASATDIIQMRPGPVMATGRPLDIALNEQAVLGVTGTDGKQAFTRRGDLRVNGTGLMETGSGHPVRNEGGQPITVPPGSEVYITGDGSIYARDPAQPNTAGTLIDKLQMRDASKVNLVRREDGLYAIEGKDGQDITNGTKPPSLTPNALEGSNVNPMQVMIKLMDQARSFEQQVRILREVKSGDEAGSSMMKLNP